MNANPSAGSVIQTKNHSEVALTINPFSGRSS